MNQDIAIRRINRRYHLFAWVIHIVIVVPVAEYYLYGYQNTPYNPNLMLAFAHTVWIAWRCRPRIDEHTATILIEHIIAIGLWTGRSIYRVLRDTWRFIRQTRAALTVTLAVGIVCLLFFDRVWRDISLNPRDWLWLLAIPVILGLFALETLRRREIARMGDAAAVGKAKRSATAFAVDDDGELIHLHDDELALIKARRGETRS